ncbi:MAG TPA: hypothetical protein VN934_03985 [Candidatus Tumulicola sp.]|nr:hypothetical protein [Candidatus Tumulicola sp.]
MKSFKIIAALTLAAFALTLAPTPQALADGAASTRNILIGTAAATLIIINHNKKVHQRYAEDAQKQAALAEQANNAKAAAAQYKTAYEHEAVVASNLKREVALQQTQINQLNAQVASLNPSGNFVSANSASTATTSKQPVSAKSVQVAMVSYGWGSF